MGNSYRNDVWNYTNNDSGVSHNVSNAGNRGSGNYRNAGHIDNFKNNDGNKQNGRYGQKSGFRDRNVPPLLFRQLMEDESVGDDG